MNIEIHSVSKEGSIDATIDGQRMSVPNVVEKTFLRGPAVEKTRTVIIDDEEVEETYWEDGEVTEEFIWASPNRHRQMLLDWEAEGNVMPVYVDPNDTLEGRRTNVLTAIKAKHAETEQEGFAHDFGPDFGALHLQLRNNTDRTNWLVVDSTSTKAIAAGMGDVEGMLIRTAENVDVPLTFSEASALMTAMSQWGFGLAQVSWAKQNAANTAATLEDLDAIDVDGGWSI